MIRLVTILATMVILGSLTACGGEAVSHNGRPTLGEPAQHASSPPAESTDACTAFNSRIWAQTVYDEDPGSNAALDPDGDNLACEELPLGIAPALWTDMVPEDAMPVELIGVTDGDTITVLVDGRRERVRLVGIDAHEAGGPFQDVECYGPQASDFLKGLLGIGGEMFIELDLEDRDRYGRLLRWVWVDFGTGEVYQLNEALVRAGYAERYRNTPNRRYLDEVMDAEEFAQGYSLGLWGSCEAGLASHASVSSASTAMAIVSPAWTPGRGLSALSRA